MSKQVSRQSNSLMHQNFLSITSFCRWALLICWGLWLAGCQPNIDRSGKPVSPSNRASVLIDNVNYMEDRAVQYTLYDLSMSPPRAVGGAIVDMLVTGGEKGCCLSLPKTWHTGMKVRLDWAESDRQQTYPERYSRELEIPRYDNPADLYVVFYADHKVELVVSEAEPGHPDWRGSIKQTPWENCLAHHDRKVCKAALPKLFDTASSQGFCTYLYEENDSDKENLCAFATDRCMKDYEDEPFCKGVLWGKRREMK